MLKIEAAALSSFQSDISKNPSLASELQSSKSIVSQLAHSDVKQPSTASSNFNRFGQSFGDDSETLLNGKKRALETIAKSLEKKNKWLEAKTAEGKTYYWNKDTLG